MISHRQHDDGRRDGETGNILIVFRKSEEHFWKHHFFTTGVGIGDEVESQEEEEDDEEQADFGSRFSMVWRLPGEKSAERNRTKTKPSGGGGTRPGSESDLGHTAGRSLSNTPQNRDGSANRLLMKAIRHTLRHTESLVSLHLYNDVEPNPGPKVWKCAVCDQRVKRTEWSVKCNGCGKWVHWGCTDLGENGRWDASFKATCCPAPPRQQTYSKRIRRKRNKREKRQRRQRERHENWMKDARNKGREETTTL